MPIQVPTINRAPVQQTSSVGRIDFQPADGLRGQAVQSAAVERLGKVAIDTYDTVQKQTADSVATDAANNYHKILTDTLASTKGIEGDPTNVQNKYYETEQKEYDNFLSKYADSSDVVKSELRKKLDATRLSFYDKASTSFTAQTNTYQSKVTTKGVSIAKDDMMTSVENLDVNDPDAVVPLENKIKEIINLREKQALRNGTAKEVFHSEGEIDPSTGKTRVVGIQKDPIVTDQIKEDLNDGISKVILNLTASGDVEGAEFLRTKYKSYLTPDTHEKVVKATEKEMTKQKGEEVFNKTRGMSEEKAVEFIDKEQDAEVRKNAMSAYTAYHSQKKRLLKNASETNYNAVLKVIQNKDIQSVYQLENDPTFKRISANPEALSAKQIDALKLRIERPKTSDPEKLHGAREALFTGKLKGMSPVDFDQLVAGLNPEDRNRITRQYENENSQTPSEQHQSAKRTASEVSKQLGIAGYLTKAPKFRNKKEYDKLNQAVSEWTIFSENFGPMSPADETRKVKEFVAEKLKREAFDPKEEFTKELSAAPAGRAARDSGVVEREIKLKFFQKNKRLPTKEELLKLKEEN